MLVFASYFFPCKRANALRGPYSFFSGEERIWKDRRRAGRGVPRPTNPPPWVGVESTAAHCTSCQADLRLHPSSDLVSKPLAASLALTTQGASLQAAVVGGFLILISSMQWGYRPPGAPFFLLRRRKNRGRKTPLRAGGPALRTHPLGGGRGCSRTLYQLPGRLVTASVIRPGEQTACRFACAYDALC